MIDIPGDEHCGEIADVAFVIDSSRSIWIYDYERQLQFVQQLVKSFDVGEDKTHIAALTFSHFVEHELDFSQAQDKEAIINKVTTILITIFITSCADPESFARGGPTLTLLFFVFFLVE